MKKLIIFIFVLLTLSACTPILPPDPPAPPSPSQYQIDGTYDLATPQGNLILSDFDTQWAVLKISVPSQGIDFNTAEYNSVDVSTLETNHYSFVAQKSNPYHSVHFNCVASENGISGWARFDSTTHSTSVTFEGVRN